MTDREFFVETLADEIPRFERVFRALPDSQLHYTPHEKSRSAHAIATTMTDEAVSFETFLTNGAVEWGIPPEKKLNSGNEFAESLTRSLNEAKTIAEGMNEEWESDAVALMKGVVVWKTTRGKMAWGLLLDLIHHRGQLSTYIRPMGGKVPSIYGPSADDAGM